MREVVRPLGARPTETVHLDIGGGEHLSCQIHVGDRPVEQVLVFYHGGGAHMNAGYQHLAHRVASSPGVAVCLPDIRGHGRSSGRRGHAKAHAVWQDVSRVMVWARQRWPDAALTLGGHSSGAGLVMNYLTRYRRALMPQSAVFLTPPLVHPRLGVPPSSCFARTKLLPIYLYRLTAGIVGSHWTGIEMDYDWVPAGARRDLVSSYSVAMADAVLPRNALRQMRRLGCPTHVILADQDDVFPTHEALAILGRAKHEHLSVSRIPAGHLQSIFCASPVLTQWLAGALS